MKLIYKNLQGDNPAECDITNGDIYINSNVWDLYNDFEKLYIIQHEKGHIQAHNAGDELQADRHAFKAIAGSQPNSLINFLRAVKKVSRNNPERVKQATRLCLEFAKQHGSEQAKQILKRYFYK